ncbi:MAG: sodium:solute symporter family protein [Deltaproteobacteria bacterium]|nr:sodium:solute symporter family protein [Deltaproteobacteria bacterium]
MIGIDWVMMIVYFVILVFMGIAAVRSLKSMDDFAIAGHRVPATVVFATLSASFIGAGYTMGTAAKGYSGGIGFLFIIGAFSIQTTLVGIFIAPKLREYEHAYTIGDVMGYHFGPLARLLTGVIAIIFCAGIVGVVARASGFVLQSVAGIPFVYAVILSAGIVVLYAAIGGMWSVVQTDILQFVVIVIAIPLTLLLGLSDVGGVGGLVEKIPGEFLRPFHNFSFLVFIGPFLGFLLGETLVPPYAQRAFVSTDVKGARTGFIAAGIYSFIWFFIVIAIGIVAYPLVPGADPDAAMVEMVLKILPHGMIGFAIASIVCVIMSTQDSFLNSGATHFYRDIYKPFFHPTVSDRGAILVGRTFTIIMGVLGIIFAISIPSLIDGLLYIYALWAPTIILPLVIVVLWKKASPYCGVYAIVFGGLVTALWIWVFKKPWGLDGLVPGIIANQIAFWVVHYLTKDWKEISRVFAPESSS